MTRRALFLDRDGVINVDHGYVGRREDFDFVEGIFDLVAAAKQQGYLVVVVTNQAGIGRGYYAESDFHALMDWVGAEFAKRGGAIDAVYFCPDHPDGALSEYAPGKPFRKPGPGMILKAIDDLGIAAEASVLVGDSRSDIAAGAAAGVGVNILYCRERPDDGVTAVTSLREVESHLVPEA